MVKIESMTNPAKMYKVVKSQKTKEYSCSCLDFKFRGHLRPCKHINARIEGIKIK